jgi:hypothetical protein
MSMVRSDSADLLFICGNFFGYAQDIVRLLESRGRKVAWFEDRPATDSLTKATIRLAPALLTAKADAYFDGIIAQLHDQPVRDVMVIKGEALSPRAIERLRAAFPHARFTLYFWDSYRNMPANSRQKAGLFDRVLSFDPQDVTQDSRLIYRPLFFVDRFAQLPGAVQDIDVLFFGTMHGDRFPVLQRIADAVPPDAHFRKFLYFPAKWLFAVHAARHPAMLWADRRDFIYVPKSRAELMQLMARSRTVVDIERPVQCGYTMRTLETLGSGRKLITTNAEVANADFYRPANILVIDRVAPKIPTSFLETPYQPVAADIVHRYSLSGWLNEVLP